MSALRRRVLIAAVGLLTVGGSLAAAPLSSAHTGACVVVNGGSPTGVNCHAPGSGGHAACVAPGVDNTYAVVCAP